MCCGTCKPHAKGEKKNTIQVYFRNFRKEVEAKITRGCTEPMQRGAI